MNVDNSAEIDPQPPAAQGAFLVRYWRDFDESGYRFLLKSVSGEGQELFEDMPTMLTRLEALLELLKQSPEE